MITDRKARILLIEDHWMLREQLAAFFNEDPAFTVCGEADNIQAALQLCLSTQPDIALVDVTLKGASGLELIKELKARELDIPVLILSMHEESLYAERVLAAGGRGYLTKHENSDTLLAAVKTVLAGEVHLSPKMTATLLNKLSGRQATAASIHQLADRELEVFQLIGRGNATREIAATLGLGVTTIDTYRARIKEKLGIRSTSELQSRAARWVQESQAAGTADAPL
jgi:DNA-binding NarL/FixJ family response regulator